MEEMIRTMARRNEWTIAEAVEKLPAYCTGVVCAGFVKDEEATAAEDQINSDQG